MSLIISLNSREGIVVAADRRTTIRNSGKVRYSDETTKIFPITNRIVTSFCGNHYLKNGDTIVQFLEHVKEEYKDNTDIFEFPAQLLYEYTKKNEESDITIVIAGYSKKGNIPMLYSVNFIKKEIEQISSGNTFGVSYHGMNDIASAIMKNITYGDLSIKEAVDLVKLTVDTTTQVYKYRMDQSVGGKTDIYLIPKDENQEARWLTNNHEIYNVDAED